MPRHCNIMYWNCCFRKHYQSFYFHYDLLSIWWHRCSLLLTKQTS